MLATTLTICALAVSTTLASSSSHRRSDARDGHFVRRSRSLRLATAPTASTSSDPSSAPAGVLLLAVNPIYNGTALWFKQDGDNGACGNLNNDTDLVMGLSTQFYSDTSVASPLCGQSVFIKNLDNGKNITAIVADASANNYTTLTIQGFRNLGVSLTDGMANISYQFLNSTGITPTQCSLAAADPDAPTANALAVPAQPTLAPSPSSSSSDAANASASQQAASSSAAAAEASRVASARSASAAAASAAAASAAAASAAAASAAAASASAAAASASAAAIQKAAPKAPSNPIAPVTSAISNIFKGGFGTFFYQNNTPGHCGKVNLDSAMVIALDSARYNNGANCGRQIRITRPSDGRSAVGTVADSCPTCKNDESLDMSVALFNKLATEAEGMVPITWEWIS